MAVPPSPGVGTSETRPEHLRKTGYLVDEKTRRPVQGIFASGTDPVEQAGYLRFGIDANVQYIIPYSEARPFLQQPTSIPPMESDIVGVVKRGVALRKWSAESQALFSRKGPDAVIYVLEMPSPSVAMADVRSIGLSRRRAERSGGTMQHGDNGRRFSSIPSRDWRRSQGPSNRPPTRTRVAKPPTSAPHRMVQEKATNSITFESVAREWLVAQAKS